MADIRIAFRLSHPAKSSIQKATPKSKVGDLVAAAFTALGVDPKDSGYSVTLVPFEADIIDIKGKYDSTLADVGLKAIAATILISPPPEKRPQMIVVPMSLNNEEKADGKKPRVSAERYKGLSKDKIISQWTGASSKTAKQIAFEFIEMHGEHALKSADFVKLLPGDFAAVVSSNALRASETAVFAAVLAYHAAHAKPDEEKEKEGVLALLKHVRIPLFSAKDVATILTPSKVLEAATIIDLYSFISQREAASSGSDDAKSLTTATIPSLAMFSSQPRVGRMPPHWFSWDKTSSHPQIVLKDADATAESNNTNCYKAVAGDIVFEEGVYEWEVQVNQIQSHQYGIIAGVCQDSFTSWSQSVMLGNSGTSGVPGFGISLYDGTKWNSGSKGTSALKAAAGDKMVFKFNAKKKELSAAVNSGASKVVFSGIDGAVRPCITVYGASSVTLKFKDDAATA